MLKKKNKQKNTTAYDANFERHLIQHGIYPYTFRDTNDKRLTPPKNFNSIKRRLAQRRASLARSTIENMSNEIEAVHDHACCEQEIIESMVPFIEGLKDRFLCKEGRVWDNFAPLTDAKVKLVNPKPDRFYGSHAHALLNEQVCRELSQTIIPSRKDELTILPNFTLEVKGPRGAGDVVKRQACYNGAFGSRAMHSLREYIHQATAEKDKGDENEGEESTLFDNNAYTISATLESITGTLTLYTTHPRKRKRADEPNQDPEQVMARLGSWCVINGPEELLGAISVYRNARDWASEQREELIRKANDARFSDKAGPLGDGGDETVQRKRRRVLKDQSSRRLT
jgi:hypothetical protein